MDKRKVLLWKVFFRATSGTLIAAEGGKNNSGQDGVRISGRYSLTKQHFQYLCKDNININLLVLTFCKCFASHQVP